MAARDLVSVLAKRGRVPGEPISPEGPDFDSDGKMSRKYALNGWS